MTEVLLKAKAKDVKATVAKAPQLTKPGAPKAGNATALQTYQAVQRAKQSWCGIPSLEKSYGAGQNKDRNPHGSRLANPFPNDLPERVLFQVHWQHVPEHRQLILESWELLK